MGGLAARYAIGKLYKPANPDDLKDSLGDSSEGPSEGTICGLEAMNFITVATPHLGSMGNRQVKVVLLNHLYKLFEFETSFLLQNFIAYHYSGERKKQTKQA